MLPAIVGGALGVWAAGTLAARLAFRRVLFASPPPRAEDGQVPADAVAWDLVAEGGAPVRALEVPPAAGTERRVPIVYFHGNAQTAGDVVPMARLLADAGHRVVVAEYRGYGASRDAGRPTERGLYADAAAVLAEVRRRHGDEVALWGTSLGSAVAVEMACRSAVRALVLVAPFTSTRALCRHHAPMLAARVVARDAFASIDKAGALRTRALVLHGSGDRLVPPAMGRALSERMAGARFVELAGAAHDVFPTHGDEVVAAVLAHLAG